MDEVSGLITKHTGEIGLERFKSFCAMRERPDYYTCKPLDVKSIQTFTRFLELKENKFPTEPSIFLSMEGFLLLEWEDDNDKIIELEFFPSKIEYYFESTEEEGVYRVSNIDKLIKKIDNI